MSREGRMRDRRKAQGLCTRCGASRGKDGTTTLCRFCADNQARRILKTRVAAKGDLNRSEDGYVMLTCENCFKQYEWRDRGQRVFCDACIPWFNRRVNGSEDYADEQEQASRVKPVHHTHRSVESLIDEWMR